MTQDHLNVTENIWDQAKDVKDISKTHKTVLKNGKLVIYPTQNLTNQAVPLCLKINLSKQSS